MKLFLNDKLGDISYEIVAADDPVAILIIAHGAGAGMHHAFMATLASKFAQRSVTTVRFNFPYMEQGKKSPRSPKDAISAWVAIAQQVESLFPDKPIFMSGKSYGGRMGSHMLLENHQLKAMQGIIYFGFPLHAPGKDSKDRAAHLSAIEVTQLFIQGSRDKLANIEMIREVVSALSNGQLHAIDLADHSFNVPKSAGLSKDEIMDELVDVSLRWIEKLIHSL